MWPTDVANTAPGGAAVCPPVVGVADDEDDDADPEVPDGTVTCVAWRATTTRPRPPTVERMSPRTAVAVASDDDGTWPDRWRPCRAAKEPTAAVRTPKARMSMRVVRRLWRVMARTLGSEDEPPMTGNCHLAFI
jgi:hypothetical protein